MTIPNRILLFVFVFWAFSSAKPSELYVGLGPKKGYFVMRISGDSVQMKVAQLECSELSCGVSSGGGFYFYAGTVKQSTIFDTLSLKVVSAEQVIIRDSVKVWKVCRLSREVLYNVDLNLMMVRVNEDPLLGMRP